MYVDIIAPDDTPHYVSSHIRAILFDTGIIVYLAFHSRAGHIINIDILEGTIIRRISTVIYLNSFVSLFKPISIACFCYFFL